MVCALRLVSFVSGGSFAYMEEKIRMYLCWKATYATRASVNYKIWLNYFIQVCGEKMIEEYDIQDLIKYKHWLEQHYSASSVQFATVSLKNFFKFYSEQGFKCLKPSLIRIPRI